MRLLRSVVRIGVLCILFACSVGAQELVERKDLQDAVRFLDNAQSKSELPCFIQFSGKPELDLLFRYTEGFLIDCRLGEKLPAGTSLVALLRVSPDSGNPAILIEHFEIPQVHPLDPTGVDAPVSQLNVTMRGGFAVGPGSYSVELVLTDLQGHTCRKLKKLRPREIRNAKAVPFALPPGAVAPLVSARWNGALEPTGGRLTVLLNIHGRDGTARLQAWDRDILLQSLATLLNQVPCRSVKLVAFDLDSQQEIFRQDEFNAEGYARLEHRLAQMNFGSIPLHALTKGTWTNFLVDLAGRETASKPSPENIVFLGAWGSHEWEKLPRDLVRRIDISNTHLYYFELFPKVGEAPDGIERLTRDLHGTVFAIRSSETLAQAIRKAQPTMTPPSDKQVAQ